MYGTRKLTGYAWEFEGGGVVVVDQGDRNPPGLQEVDIMTCLVVGGVLPLYFHTPLPV